MPRDAVQAGEAIELAPQVDVLHRLFVGGPPAAALPVEQPLADAFLHVLRISVDLDLAGALQQLQRANDRGELHAIVGRLLLTAEDRKSTRLNSSHLVISYAVFCLKKKNTV